MNKLRDNIFFNTLQKTYVLLNKKQKSQVLLMIFFTIFGGFFDVIGLAAIIPVIMTIQNPAVIHDHKLPDFLFKSLGFTNDNSFLIFIVICLLMLFIFKNALSFSISYYQARFAANISTYFSQNIFRQYYKRPYLFFKNNNSALLITNIMQIPGMFSTNILLPTTIIINEIFVILLVVCGIAYYNFSLFGVLAAILGPTFFILYKSTKKKITEIGLERHRLLPAVHAKVTQAIRGFVDVKLFNKEHFFMSKYIEDQIKLSKGAMLAYMFNFVPAKTTEVVAVLGIVLVFIYTILFAANKSELTLFLVLFATAAYRIIPSMNRMLMALLSIRNYQYSFDVLKEIRHEDVSHFKPKQVIPYTFKNNIVFNHVSFKFPDGENYTLKNIYLEIKKGEVIGFIGKSGSGKTTLINTLLRFLPETSGEIVVDGKKLTAEDTDSWRAIIGYVKQDIFILDASLKENIAFGETKDTIDEVKLNNAIEQASLKEFVSLLPDGTNTSLGEMGSKLSGGQKQRIEIARALYKNAEIILFDEATSALDTKTEREIVESIEKLTSHQKTIVIIAHRLTTLRRCNRIYEMKEGEVIGTYNYNEIIDRELKLS